MASASKVRSCSVLTTSDGQGMTRATTRSRSYAGTSRSRPRTAATSTGYDDNEIICAVSESRGLCPTVGLAFVNLTTSEAVLCQFADTQTYARTCHKISVFNPSDILYMSTATDSNLVSIIAENLQIEDNQIIMTEVHRKYWADGQGHDYIQRLAFLDDRESLKISAGGNFFATCCFAAAMSFAEMAMSTTFAPHTLRLRFESSEGAMMVDLSTISSMELIQNLQNTKSRDSLFGLMNETLTKMGERTLRSNLLQPSTDAAKISERYDAVNELTIREEMFLAVLEALSIFVDTDRCLSALVKIPTKFDIEYIEQSINHVLMLKTFVDAIKSLWQSMSGAESDSLYNIRQLCAAENYAEVDQLLKYALNEDVRYVHKPAELRNQRVFAIRVGVNGFLDVARTTYKEINQDVHDMAVELSEEYHLNLTLKFEPARSYYLRVDASEFDDRVMPDTFVNIVRRKHYLECQTLDLMKMNQKIKDAHDEVISMSDRSIQELIDAVRSRIHPLFKISEAIGLLDMLCAFAHLATARDYVKPELTGALAIKAGRHPIREKTQVTTHKWIANDVYATRQNRFQIITGCNMSGKSTYIRSIALMAIMAQTGSFVPASYASFPVFRQLFARVSTDSAVEANVSTFAAEMRDIAHILRNIEARSLVIVDELGRGTSTTDGLAIAISIAEALIESKAFVWFVTHFRDLPRVLAERAGVVNLHLSVNFSTTDDDPTTTKMKMTYKVSDGAIPPENQFYGLALARAICLPDRVIDVATQVSEELNERIEARKSDPGVLAVSRRRKLLLSIREQLLLVKESSMNGPELYRWLKKLQEEVIVRMEALDRDARRVGLQIPDDSEEPEQQSTCESVGAAKMSLLGEKEQQALSRIHRQSNQVAEDAPMSVKQGESSDTSTNDIDGDDLRRQEHVETYFRVKQEKLDDIARQRPTVGHPHVRDRLANVGGSKDEAIVID